MENFINKLKTAQNKLLQSEAESIKKWVSPINGFTLKHNKQSLELFLKFNIVDLEFIPKNGKTKRIICTSNTKFIDVFKQIRQKDKNKAMQTSTYDGIATRESFSVLTYNILALKYNTVSLKSWKIVNFIEIMPNNILLLDQIINEILQRKIEK